MANLAAKHRPKNFDDVTEQTIIVNMLKNICSQENLSHRNFLFIGPAGCGKAQPLDSTILTPSGFVRMGDIRVGDNVFTGNGNIGTVSGIYPQGVRPIYEIKLQDRTSIRVSDEHLNCIWWYDEDHKQRMDKVVTTKELIDLIKTSRFKLRIDIPELDWDSKEVPIDPYLVGAMIGDGSLSGNFAFSNSEPDVVAKVDSILHQYDCKLVKCPGDNVDYSICSLDKRKYIAYLDGVEYDNRNQVLDVLESEGYPRFDCYTLNLISDGTAINTLRHFPELKNRVRVIFNPTYDGCARLRKLFDSMNLLHRSIDKHIPDIYLYNSKEVRYRLLQGLFDTDGYSSLNSDCCTTDFSTSSERLSQDFSFLVRSLGIRDTVSVSPSSYVDKKGIRHDCHMCIRHMIKIPDGIPYYSSLKHTSNYHIHQHNPVRNILSVEYVGDELCQCIMVDHTDHTYISGDGLIPTHNTTTGRIVANMLNDGKGDVIEIDAASHNGVESVRELVKQMRTYPVGCKYKVFILDEVHSFSSMAWQAMLKPIEDQPAKTVIILCTTNPEKIPATILSRVQTFQLSKISLQGIINRLKHIIEEENKEGQGITYTEDAIAYIAKLANGGMRDSITLLEKSLSYSKDITIENLSKSLDLPNYEDYFTLLNGIAKKDNVIIVQIIDSVYNSGTNFVKWFEGFHSFIANIIKYIFIQDINATMIPSYYQDKISGYNSAHATLCLKLASKLVRMNQELKGTQYLQELAITYLCAVPTKARS